jgi:nicotinate-nucleotide pyrophosphorylase (carboxylating)
MKISFEEQLEDLIAFALREDIGDGDHTTLSCIASDAKGKAHLKVKQEGVLAGIEIARSIFHFLEPGASIKCYANDGDLVQLGSLAFEIEASVHSEV